MMNLPREDIRTRFCAELGGCDDPYCYLCQDVAKRLQPPTYHERKRREEQRQREERMKKGRKKVDSGRMV